MTMKNEEELTCRFKTDMRNLKSFDQNFHFNRLLLRSINCLSQKSTEEISFTTMKSDAKFGEEWHKDLLNFDPNTQNSQHFSL